MFIFNNLYISHFDLFINQTFVLLGMLGVEMEQQEEANKKNEREGTNTKGYAGHCKLNSDKTYFIFFCSDVL